MKMKIFSIKNWRFFNIAGNLINKLYTVICVNKSPFKGIKFNVVIYYINYCSIVLLDVECLKYSYITFSIISLIFGICYIIYNNKFITIEFNKMLSLTGQICLFTFIFIYISLIISLRTGLLFNYLDKFNELFFKKLGLFNKIYCESTGSNNVNDLMRDKSKDIGINITNLGSQNNVVAQQTNATATITNNTNTSTPPVSSTTNINNIGQSSNSTRTDVLTSTIISTRFPARGGSIANSPSSIRGGADSAGENANYPNNNNKGALRQRGHPSRVSSSRRLQPAYQREENNRGLTSSSSRGGNSNQPGTSSVNRLNQSRANSGPSILNSSNRFVPSPEQVKLKSNRVLQLGLPPF